MLNYDAEALVFLQPKTPGFKLDKFAPFIHGANIKEINNELNDAIYHIERTHLYFKKIIANHPNFIGFFLLYKLTAAFNLALDSGEGTFKVE